MVSRLSVLLAALALLAGIAGPRVAAADPLPQPNRETMRLTTEALRQDSTIVPFRTENFFKMVLANYRQLIKDVSEDRTLTPEQKKTKTDKLVAQAYELLVIYDQIQSAAPVAFAITIHFFGLEIPIPFYNLIPRLGQYSTLALEGSIGVTLAVTQNPATARKDWALGLSTLFGANLTFTKQVDKMEGAKFFGVSVFIPSGAQRVPAMRVGDLQRWYHGIAAEMSLEIGTRLVGARTYQVGLYTNTSFDTLLIFFFGSTAQDRKFALQWESLAFTTLYAPDGSTPRSPIPGTGNFSTSPHNPSLRALEAERRAMPTEAQIKDAIQRSQRNLENVR